MRDVPQNLQALLRAALQAKVELGTDEIIVNRAEIMQAVAESAAATPAAPTPAPASTGSADDDWVNELDGIRRLDAGSDLFAGPSASDEPQHASLDEHRAAICECQNCPLGATRNKFVYGVGSPTADLLFVGEAPGADEDRLGEPFVGRAGQLLDRILKAMNLARDQVYIANILKCRPPNNRDPLPEEMAECFPYLKEQIRLIRPKLMCALGRIAGQALLDTKTPLGKLRGRWHEFEGIPLLVTYHPAALLRFPAYKKDTWADMQMIMARLNKDKE